MCTGRVHDVYPRNITTESCVRVFSAHIMHVCICTSVRIYHTYFFPFTRKLLRSGIGRMYRDACVWAMCYFFFIIIMITVLINMYTEFSSANRFDGGKYSEKKTKTGTFTLRKYVYTPCYRIISSFYAYVSEKKNARVLQ